MESRGRARFLGNIVELDMFCIVESVWGVMLQSVARELSLHTSEEDTVVIAGVVGSCTQTEGGQLASAR